MPQHCLRLALLAALASSGVAAAQPPADPQAATTVAPNGERPPVVGFWYGHVESDNIGRTETPEDGSYETLGVVTDLARRSRRLTANLNTDLEYRDYSLDSVDSEVVGTLSANADVELVQDRFRWLFADQYGQGITDPRGGIGPGNREQINVITTGPKLQLTFGARTSLELTGSWSQRKFDESNNVDSESVLGELGIYRQASSTARFGLVFGSNNVDYDEVTAPEYDIERVAIRYEKELATGRVQADVGTNEISTGPFKDDAPLYNLVWTRSLTARSDLSLRASRAITDAGSVLVANLAPGLEGEPFTDVVVTPNPLEQSRIGLSYAVTLSRTTLSAELSSSQDEYIGNATNDNDTTTLHLAFVRTVTERLNFGISYEDVERELKDGSATGEDSWTVAWVNRTFGRRMFAGLAISTYDRSGPQSYDEQRYELRFGYSPTGSGVASMASIGR